MYGYERVCVGGRSMCRTAAITAVVTITGLGLPAFATAEVGWPVPTAQAVAMEAEFLIDPAIPPPARAAVCMIDSGVADSAVGEFGAGQLTRFTMQDGDPVTDTHEGQHGTWMARYMGAARDGSGMVGIWPGVEIVSVRALVGEGQTFPYSAYKSGIDACLRLKFTGVPIVAISLSLGGTSSPSNLDVARLTNATGDAMWRGVSVFAAVGNEPGPVLSPAREVGVIGVGAGNATIDVAHGGTIGQPCFRTAGEAPFASDGRDVIAPGCFLDGGTSDGTQWGGSGSSHATAVVSAVYAALRAYCPELSRGDAESALLVSSGQVGGWVSAARLFDAAGMDWRILTRARPSQPIAGAEALQAPSIYAQKHGPDSVKQAAAVDLRPVRLPTPRFASRIQRGNRIALRTVPGNRPKGSSIVVGAFASNRRELLERSSNRHSRLSLFLPSATRFVKAWFQTDGRTVSRSRKVVWKTRGIGGHRGEFG